jgi:hypothetical protein
MKYDSGKAQVLKSLIVGCQMLQYLNARNHLLYAGFCGG